MSLAVDTGASSFPSSQDTDDVLLDQSSRQTKEQDVSMSVDGSIPRPVSSCSPLSRSSSNVPEVSRFSLLHEAEREVPLRHGAKQMMSRKARRIENEGKRWTRRKDNGEGQSFSADWF